MNAILPDDLSHYERIPRMSAAREIHHNPSNDRNPASDWDGHSGLEMDPGTEMNWVGPEPLR